MIGRRHPERACHVASSTGERPRPEAALLSDIAKSPSVLSSSEVNNF